MSMNKIIKIIQLEMAEQNRLFSFLLDYTFMIAPSPISSRYVTGFTQPMLASNPYIHSSGCPSTSASTSQVLEIQICATSFGLTWFFKIKKL